jgi:mannan polymerase II complex ANP1 subunit
MAKRLQFSVVGLPHYTIWHLYEPSVDDLKHMEEMERETKAKEIVDKAEKERLKQIQSQFDNPSQAWAEEKAMLAQKAQDATKKDKVEAKDV